MNFKALLSLLSYIYLSFFSIISYAQLFNPIQTRIDVGAAWKDKSLNIGFLYNQYLKLDNRGIFQVGWAVRGSHLKANTLDYITAPSELTRGKSGLAINAPLVMQNIDTLQLKTSVTSFRACLEIDK